MLYKPASKTSTLSILWEELQPFPGRLDQSLRIALVCVLVTVTAMALEVPEAALSCYLVFFASRADAGAGIVTAAGVLVGATIGIGLGILCLMVVADDPLLRLALVAFFTFGGMFLAQASKAGPPVGTVAMVFAFVMTLYDIVPIAELLVRALAWMWVVVFFPMVYLIALNVVAGRSPAKLLRSEIAERLEVAADLVAGGGLDAQQRAGKLLAAGNSELGKYKGFASLLSLMNKREALRASELVAASYALLTLALARAYGGTGFGQGGGAAAGVLRGLAGDIRARRLRETAAGPAETRALAGLDADITRPIEEIAAILSRTHEPRPVAAAEEGGFFATDAFTNPVYTQFALKTLLAVMITYTVYTAFDWFAIHTAMITCFMVALGTTGETMHKLTLRIFGCLIGGAMGIASIVWLMPGMTDIGQLALLVAGASFIAAWVSTGSERISYMGWQMALCFFLVILHDFGPSLDIDVARDRVIGIIFGNVVVSVVFSTIWPVSIGNVIRARLADSVGALAALMGRRGAPTLSYEDLATGLAGAMRQNALLRFETPRVRRSEIDAEVAENIAEKIEAISVPIVLLRQREAVYDVLRRMPKSVKRAADDYENIVTDWLRRCIAEARTGQWPASTAELSSALRRVKAGYRRAERDAGARGGRLPRRIRDEMTARLHLYEQIEHAVARTVSRAGAA